MTGIMKPAEAGKYIAISPATMAKWRHFGKGPKYVKLGRAVRYRKEDLDNWLYENLQITVTRERKSL